jgi:hypothetical protein
MKANNVAPYGLPSLLIKWQNVALNREFCLFLLIPMRYYTAVSGITWNLRGPWNFPALVNVILNQWRQ